MPRFLNSNLLDIITLRWGSPPVPLLPRAVRSHWAAKRMPKWLAAEGKLPPRATFQSLDATFWDGAKRISQRGEHFLRFFVTAHSPELEDVRAIDCVWPIGLHLDQIPVSTRTRNSLRDAGLWSDPKELTTKTVAQLLEIRGLGAKGLIELTTLSEAAVDMFNTATRLATEDTASARDPTTLSWKARLNAALPEPWIDQVSAGDPRFAPLLLSGAETLQERIESVLLDPEGATSADQIPRLLESIDAVRLVANEISQLTLEDALQGLLKAALGANRDRLKILLARFGWAGSAPLTLQACGNMLSLTRERIRQIEKKARTNFPRHPAYLPQLDRALEILQRKAPIRLSDAEELLVAERISGIPFPIQSLIETADLLGRPSGISIDEVRGAKVVSRKEDAIYVTSMYKYARKHAGRSGIASVFMVADALGSSNFSDDDVRRTLTGMEGVDFLDDDWFWITTLPPNRNRLVNVLRRILSVASPQTVTSIREGVRRVFGYRQRSHARYESIAVPPLAPLMKFLSRHPEFSIVGDAVVPRRTLLPQKLLGPIEQAIYGVFSSIPSGVLDRRSLMEECIARGVNENSASIFITYSPIVEHVGLDIWKLRGRKVDPAAVEALRQTNQFRGKDKRTLDYGWRPDGRLWIASRVPRSSASVVFNVPGPVRSYLMGRSFKAVDKESSREVGTISVGPDATSWGYGPFLRRTGGELNDVLMAEFSLAGGDVLLSLTDDAAITEET